MDHYILHKFKPFDTIDAILRLRGRHNYTPEEIAILRGRFNELNGPVVPRAGDIFKIPLERVVVDDYGDMVDASVPVPIESDPAHEREDPLEHEHPGDPCEPDRKLPPEPHPGAAIKKTPEKNGDQQVTPDSGERPSQELNGPELQPAQASPTLVISGARRVRR